MPHVLFEVWEDARAGYQEACFVHPQNDKVRLSTCPKAVMVHSIQAYSDRDFWRQFYAWDGRGEWEPDLNLPEHFFTEAEAAEQDGYLKIRNLL